MFLQSGAFPAEEKDLVALALFVFPTEPSVLTRPGAGYAADDAEAGRVVERFVAEGLLQDATGNLEALLQGESSATLKALAKERKLPSSATKDILAKRLVAADPEAMRARFQGKRFYSCSVKGAILAGKWREAGERQKELTEGWCLQALKQGRFSDACMARAASGASRLEPLGIGANSANYDLSSDVEVLQTIFTGQIKRQAAFDQEVMAGIRLAAAMMHLWGTNNARRWLPEGAERQEIDWTVEARMLLFYALGKRSIQAMKQAGIKRVEILVSGNQDDCPICRSDSGKVFPIDSVPTLPYEHCTCETGCGCVACASR
jgi:hypothetical protein